MKITDVPMALLRFQYGLARFPLQVIEERVLPLIDSETPAPRAGRLSGNSRTRRQRKSPRSRMHGRGRRTANAPRLTMPKSASPQARSEPTKTPPSGPALSKRPSAKRRP